jgi:hypothetical protein
MLRFIHALGAKYDGDPRIAFVTAGLFGFWGEWHVVNHPYAGEDPGWSMSQKDKDALLAEYRSSFRKTSVLVRYPWVTEQHDLLTAFGFHDDSFLKDTLGPEDWQFWHGMQSAGLAEIWKLHPIGGEVYPQLQSGLWDAWPNHAGQDVGTTITTAHVTWMIDNELFDHKLSRAERTNALRAQRMLGYTLFCSAARLVRLADGSAAISMRVQNRGVAPFYASWPAEFDALDRHGNVVAQGHAAWPLSALLPGQTAEWNAALGPLPERAKSVIVRYANPLPNGHPLVFANAEMGTRMPGWLTLGALEPAP